MKYQRGQISTLAMWLIGVLGTIAIGAGSWTFSQTAAVGAVGQENANRITVTEVKIDNVQEDIKEIKDDVKIIRNLLER